MLCTLLLVRASKIGPVVHTVVVCIFRCEHRELNPSFQALLCVKFNSIIPKWTRELVVPSFRNELNTLTGGLGI